MKKSSLKKQNHVYLIRNRQRFKGTVVNPAFLSLIGGSLEIRLNNTLLRINSFMKRK